MNIRELRESAGLTQGELAAELGVKRSAVSMWEIGKSRPRTEDLPKLAETLHCSIDDLYASDAAQEGV